MFLALPTFAYTSAHNVPRTHFFRIPVHIVRPVVLFEGTSARVVEFEEAGVLADADQAEWGNSQDIRSNRGKLTVKTCRRLKVDSRGLSLTMSPKTPLSRAGGDFRRGVYHNLLDGLASDRESAHEFLNSRKDV